MTISDQRFNLAGSGGRVGPPCPRARRAPRAPRRRRRQRSSFTGGHLVRRSAGVLLGRAQPDLRGGRAVLGTSIRPIAPCAYRGGLRRDKQERCTGLGRWATRSSRASHRPSKVAERRQIGFDRFGPKVQPLRAFGGNGARRATPNLLNRLKCDRGATRASGRSALRRRPCPWSCRPSNYRRPRRRASR